MMCTKCGLTKGQRFEKSDPASGLKRDTDNYFGSFNATPVGNGRTQQQNAQVAPLLFSLVGNKRKAVMNGQHAALNEVAGMPPLPKAACADIWGKCGKMNISFDQETTAQGKKCLQKAVALALVCNDIDCGVVATPCQVITYTPPLPTTADATAVALGSAAVAVHATYVLSRRLKQDDEGEESAEDFRGTFEVGDDLVDETGGKTEGRVMSVQNTTSYPVAVALGIGGHVSRGHVRWRHVGLMHSGRRS